MFSFTLITYPAIWVFALTCSAWMANYLYKMYRTNKQLILANQAKDRLIAIIGHDLRSPIGGIAKLLALLEEDEETDLMGLRQMISAMRKQGDACFAILNSLLMWGNIQMKGTQINPVNFSLHPLVEKNVQILQEFCADKGLDVLNLVPPALTAFGDVDHFDFILRNLLSNAAKFSFPSGKITIQASPGPVEGQLLFCVRDCGKGISKVQQEQFSVSNMNVEVGTKGEKGAGIGLMICKEFIKASGGKIWFESEKDKGTAAFFTFRTGT